MSTIKELYDPAQDERWAKPFIDKEEDQVRTLDDGTKVKYHYFHGGFEDTGVKFSFCMPEKDQYEGRFFQYLSPFPGPDEEMASFALTGEDDRICFALTHGAYFVESNMGSKASFGPGTDPCMTWQSSAAVAEYSREVAMKYYGTGRPFGYVHGGSGGGYKTMSCIENTAAWDGAVPFVIGSPYSLPNTITLHVQGQRTLRGVFQNIVDALDAGGSGDMYEGLNEDQKAMLKEITLMGFPPKAWFLEAGGLIDPGSLPVLTPGVKQMDPSFFQEFWTVPGYAGTDPESNACRDRLTFQTVVKSVHLHTEKTEAQDLNDVDGAWKKQLADGRGSYIEVEEVPAGDDLYTEGVNITFSTGEAVGEVLLLDKIQKSESGKGGFFTIGMCFGMDDLDGVLSSIKPGDEIRLDNSDYIAIQHYYRHQCPSDANFHAWDQFRKEDGTPAIPQRSFVMGPGFTGTGRPQDGNIQCKTIVIQSMMDESTCPWCGDWYRGQVARTKGSEDDFRLYYMDRCLHGNVSTLMSTYIVNYLGALNQAMLDVSAWVERGVEPAPTTVYQMVDNQVEAAPTADRRKGLQPVVTLLANGEKCVRVKAGEAVTLTATAVVPEGTGTVTALDFEFEADDLVSPGMDIKYIFHNPGEFTSYMDGNCHAAKATMTHIYSKPGTYFAAVRVKSERNSDAGAQFTQVQNLDRARIIVE